MSCIKIYEKKTPEYDKLRRAAAILTGLSPNGYKYEVGETYFDFGQDWKWTTILCHCTGRGFTDTYQALSLAAQERVILSPVEELPAVCADVLAGKFCPDRIKE